MDYTKTYESWEKLDDCRIRIALDGDGGENLWGKQVGEGLVGINNMPLHKEYRYQDIVKRVSSAQELVHRRWVEELVFNYNPVEEVEENKALRARIWDAVEGCGGMMSFWVDGVGVVLAESADQLSVIVEVLEDLDIGFSLDISSEEE